MRTSTRLLSTATALVLALPFLVAAQEEPAEFEVTIVRDSFGVPHVYADTREAVAYGAGYALAQDRLWQMHLFRHIGKGELSDILGPIVLETDETVRFFTYTEEERERRFLTYPDDVRTGVEAFVAGINAWIDEANSDPSKMPFEFVEFGEAPIEPWAVTDTISLQDVLILAFGSGGGNELAYAELLERLVDAHGDEQAAQMFDDLIRTDDPDDTVSIPEDLDWAATPTGGRDVEAESRRALTPDARISLLAEEAPDGEDGEDDDGGDGGLPSLPGGLASGASAAATSAAPAAARGTLAQLGLVPDAQRAYTQARPLLEGFERLQAMFTFGSNAQLVGPSLSETANTLQTGGPQVGYLVPQWLSDFGLHGGGLDATGMTFAGAGPAVLIGRGNGYAWTSTTGASDLTDTYVEKLNPDDPRQYEFNGEWENMECRDEVHTFRGVPFSSQEICRTRHGPVLAFDEENGVAYSLRYAWFDREGQTVEGFWRYNESESLEDYATFSNYLASNHNMFYSDDQGHSGYWHPGNHPIRPDGIDLRLPQDGTGGSEWQGLRPVQDVPHAVDPDRDWLVNWNNAPAAGWERERAWPARDNVDDLVTAHEIAENAALFERLRAAGEPLPQQVEDPRSDGGTVNPDGLWDFEDLSANLRYAAMKDHVETWFRSTLPVAEDLESELAQRALRMVHAWDGFLLDRDEDGEYDSAGTTVLRAWVDAMRDDAFADLLGDDIGFARSDGELWHLVSPDSSIGLEFGWLGDETRQDFVARTFEATVAALAEEFGTDDPQEWRTATRIQAYQRLNADLFADLVRRGFCDGGFCEGPFDPRGDSGFPGDIPEHIAMDRGTYNHVVQYLAPPRSARGASRDGIGRDQTPLGEVAGRAGSVIPPGQNGFINLAGREGPHFEDQLPLYTGWLYKPMPMTFEESMRLRESVTTITFSPPPAE